MSLVIKDPLTIKNIIKLISNMAVGYAPLRNFINNFNLLHKLSDVFVRFIQFVAINKGNKIRVYFYSARACK